MKTKNFFEVVENRKKLGTKVLSLGANQTVLTLPSGVEVLYSYETPVAVYVPSEGYVVTSKKWSSTTARHIRKWVPNGERFDTADQEVVEMLAGEI